MAATAPATDRADLTRQIAEHASTLVDLAIAVLPASLTERGAVELIARFLAWLDEYDPTALGVPIDGAPQRRHERPSRTLHHTYIAQLRVVDETLERRGVPFRALQAAEQQALIATLVREASNAIPPSPCGQSVIADLASLYYSSREGRAVLYGRAVGRPECAER
jgi:hypothetical protein